MFSLGGRVVLVSGGNAGIGLGFARGIARAGGDVVIWGRRAEKNREAAKALAEFGGRVLTQVVDVSSESRVVEAMADAVDEMGRIDGVIANAGMMRNEGSFLDMTSEAWHSLLAINQHGAYLTAREGARHMKSRFDAGDPGGSLLFCASLSALTGSPGMQHYNAAKGALLPCLGDRRRGRPVRHPIQCGLPRTYRERDGPAPRRPSGDESCPLLQPDGTDGTPEEFEGIGVYFMSNDRVSIRVMSWSLRVVGWPTLASPIYSGFPRGREDDPSRGDQGGHAHRQSAVHSRQRKSGRSTCPSTPSWIWLDRTQA